MQGWLRRLPVYRQTIEAALAREGLPTGLVFVAMIESGFTSARAVQPGRGRLLAVPGRHRPRLRPGGQLLGGRAAGSGEELGGGGAVPGRPVRPLRQLGAGPGRLQRRLSRRADQRSSASTPTTSTPSRQLESGLPWETTEYVPKIFAAAIVERNRRCSASTDVVAEPPRELEPVTAPPGASFEAIARRLGCPRTSWSLLNAAYIRRRAPPDRRR